MTSAYQRSSRELPHERLAPTVAKSRSNLRTVPTFAHCQQRTQVGASFLDDPNMGRMRGLPSPGQWRELTNRTGVHLVIDGVVVGEPFGHQGGIRRPRRADQTEEFFS
jgi:hypothetical protein